MKTSKIFILVVVLLAFLATLGWIGVRQVARVIHAFDHVARVDLVLMETAINLNDLQLKKEIIFTRLSSSSEELAFGHMAPARLEYLDDYIKGLEGEFDSYIQAGKKQMQRIGALPGVPEDLKNSFDQIHLQMEDYDATVKKIFSLVERGGFQLSLDDLDVTDDHQKILTEHLQVITSQIWDLVQQSAQRSERWKNQSKLIFWFSLLLTLTLGLLLFAFKENLDELGRQKKDLEKLNQELDRFVHTVSHDIAAPLTTIVGYAAYLESQYATQLDERGKSSISGLRKGATRLSVLIKDMLELTKMTRVKNPYSKVPMQEIMDAALANFEYMIKQTSAHIDIEKKLPEIVCDRIKMTAVFSNIISNALKFNKPGEAPSIKISWDENLKEYTFYIKDNGIGIEAANHTAIFDIFKRIHAENSGSGVGLAIVKAAIEDHGGQIRVESIAGQGATFIFTIPKNLTPARPLY